MKILRNSFLLGILMISTLLSSYSQEDINFQLLEACADSSLDKAIACVERDANVNARTEFGYTGLMYACDLGHIDLAMYLLDHGANINDSSWYEWNTALLFATRQNNLELTELLIRREAAINQKNYEGQTALHLAVLNHAYDMAEMLLYYEIDIQQSDRDGNTALHLAAEMGDQEMCYILLIHGAGLEPKNLSGMTPLMSAANAGQSSCAMYLIENGADKLVMDLKGINLLQSACLSGNYELADSLLAGGFDINQKLADKMSLYQYAKLDQNINLQNYLITKNIRKFQGFLIDKAIISLDNTINLNDYFLGGEFGLHESYTNAALILGINGRLSREAIHIQQDEEYQFWEHRMNIHIAAQKYFRLAAYKYKSTGIYLTTKEILSLGWWDGTSTSPGESWIFAPGAGCYIEGKHFFASAGVEYFSIPNNASSPFHLNFKLGIYISEAL